MPAQRDPWFAGALPEAGLWSACIALLLALHASHPIDSDEGVILNGAWHILQGRSLYTNFFEYVPPGSFYLVAGLWQLFSPRFWVAQSAGMFAILAAVAGMYCLSRLVLAQLRVSAPRWAQFFGPLLLCLFSGYWPAINHNTFNIALLVWSAFFFARSIARDSWVDAAIAGLLCGVAAWFLQHRSGVMAAAIVLILVAQARLERSQSWKLAAAFVLGCAPVVASMLLFWPTSLLAENLIRFPAAQYLRPNRLDLNLFILAAAVPCAAAWLLRGCATRAVWSLMGLQAALLLTALQRPDLCHITLVLFPLLAIFPALVAARRNVRESAVLMTWVASCLLILGVPVALHLPGIDMTRQITAFFNASQHPTVRYVREHCTSSPYVYAGPFAPGLYFETGKLNPTRYSILLPNLNTAAQYDEAVQDLQRQAPPCVITNYAMAEKFRYTRNNPIDDHIRAHYRVAHEQGSYEVWKLQASKDQLTLPADELASARRKQIAR